MHIIGILTAIAVLIYWVTRAAGSARDSGLTAAWQRKKRWDYSNVNAGSDLDALTTPLDAAAALMIMVGRDGVNGELGTVMRQSIELHLENDMDVDLTAAQETIKNVSRTLRNTTQADTIISPCCKILRETIERGDAVKLADILDTLFAQVGTDAADKKQLIYGYKERMGLLG